MGSRTIQLAVLVVLGIGIGLLISRPWEREPSMDAPAAVEDTRPVEPAVPIESAPPPLPSRTFKLPAMRLASAPAAVRDEKPEVRPPEVHVPRDWLLRGSGPQHYDVRSDKSQAMSGERSVLIAAFNRNVPDTEFASLMQNVVAEPWLGKRVVFSVNLKGRGRFQDAELWMRAIDGGGVVIAYNSESALVGKDKWDKDTVALDVPWSATELAYGVKVRAQNGVWVDGAWLEAVDRNADVGARNLPGQLGVVAQEANVDGPLSRPTNMDFEDVGPARASFRQAPEDQLGRNRF